MAIILTIDAPGVTQEQYDAVNGALTAQGLGAPEGRIFHAAGPGPNGWHVTDVWESEEALGPFAQTLVPLMQAHGVNAQPVIFPAHNIVKGG